MNILLSTVGLAHGWVLCVFIFGVFSAYKSRAIAERDNAVALLATSSAGQPTTFNGVVDDSNSNSNSREPPSQPSDASTTKVSFQPSTRKQEPPLAMAPVPSTSGSDGINDNGKNGFFCSELVAALYQRLGLLDAPFPSSSDYVPADFAQELVLESIGGSSGAEPETFRQAGSSHHTAAVTIFCVIVLVFFFVHFSSIIPISNVCDRHFSTVK